MSDATAGNPSDSPRQPYVRVTAGGAVIGVLVAVILALVVGGYLLYTSEERILADARQANASVSEQLGRSQQETRNRQGELDSTLQQLARAKADTAEALAAGKALADQLSQSQQQAQQAEAKSNGLQGDKDDLTKRLAAQETVTREAQAANSVTQQKMRRALARAQLVDQFVKLSTAAAGADTNAMTLSWVTSLSALGDPTVNEYLRASFSNPKDSASLTKLLAYLSGSVVSELR